MMKRDLISYLLTDTVEGFAIDYWARITDIVRAPDGYVESFNVHDHETEKCITIDQDKILDARELIINGNVKVGKEIAQQFVGFVDDWDYDQIGIDVLIQVAMFGEIVYG